MRRTAAMGATVIVVAVVLSTPVARHRVSTGLGSLAEQVRERLAAFRTDYATREAELRERLLPEDAATAAAAQRRAEAADTEPARPFPPFPTA